MVYHHRFCAGAARAPLILYRKERDAHDASPRSSMTIQQVKTDDGLTLLLEGRLDTGTAGQAQKDFLAAAAAGVNMTLDFTNVAYVSSAGLRALLMLQKAMSKNKRQLQLTCVRPEIREVFDMTGFSSILSIS